MIVSLSLTGARAQDALRSALSLDRTLEANTNGVAEVQPGQPHIGPVQLSLGAYSGVSYDDNINASQNDAQSDVLLRAGLNLGCFWPATGRSDLRLGAGIGYLGYVHHSKNGGLEITPNSALTYAASIQDTTITLFDQFNYSREVQTEASLANLPILPRLENTVGARIAWSPGQWTAEAGYSHDDFLAENSANAYLNRSSEFFFARAGRQFAEATGAGLEASGSLTDYQLSTQSDNYSVSVGPYINWQARPFLRIDLRGGPTFYVFQSTAAASQSSSLGSYYFSLQADHRLTDYLSQHMTATREVQLGLNQGSDYIEQLTLNYTVTWSLTDYVDLGAGITYENGSQPLPAQSPAVFVPATIERFDRIGGGPQVSWRFSDKLSASLSYSRWQRGSNLPNRNYTENSTTIQFTYAY